MKKYWLILSLVIVGFVISLFWFFKDNNDYSNNAKDNQTFKPSTYEAETLDKTAIFFGDSITKGFLTNGYSWANYIGDNYDLKTCVNAGKSDYRVSTYDNTKKWLVNEVLRHYDDKINYDFVILHGGINDLFYNTPIGKLSDSFDENTFDSLTFLGGLEIYLSKVTQKWPNAHIGYIINYITPNYMENGKKWTANDYLKYYDALKKGLDKWRIPYIDLSSQDFSDLLQVNTNYYLPDYLHLNKMGYDIISPYIYKWMKSIKPFS